MWYFYSTSLCRWAHYLKYFHSHVREFRNTCRTRRVAFKGPTSVGEPWTWLGGMNQADREEAANCPSSPSRCDEEEQPEVSLHFLLWTTNSTVILIICIYFNGLNVLFFSGFFLNPCWTLVFPVSTATWRSEPGAPLHTAHSGRRKCVRPRCGKRNQTLNII